MSGKAVLHTAIFISYTSCTSQPEEATVATVNQDSVQNQAAMTARMQQHLDAVSNRDLKTLQATLSPQGDMQLILPGLEIINATEGFMDYHRTWFEDTTWTFDTKILNTRVDDQLGTAVVEIVYREPDRNGKPYFNRMNVSYVLAKDGGQWYIIKDHASSVEKSTP